MNYYTVDIVVRVRNGSHEGPSEALADAMSQLSIPDNAVVSRAEVVRRPSGAVNPPAPGRARDSDVRLG